MSANDNFSHFILFFVCLNSPSVLKDDYSGIIILGWYSFLSAHFICHPTTFKTLWILMRSQLLNLLRIPSMRSCFCLAAFKVLYLSFGSLIIICLNIELCEFVVFLDMQFNVLDQIWEVLGYYFKNILSGLLFLSTYSVTLCTCLYILWYFISL